MTSSLEKLKSIDKDEILSFKRTLMLDEYISKSALMTANITPKIGIIFILAGIILGSTGKTEIIIPLVGIGAIFLILTPIMLISVYKERVYRLNEEITRLEKDIIKSKYSLDFEIERSETDSQIIYKGSHISKTENFLREVTIILNEDYEPQILKTDNIDEDFIRSLEVK